MPRLIVSCFSISLDGYGAGPDQDLDNPMGRGAGGLHTWLRTTRTFRTMIGAEGGETGEDDAFAARGFENIGAWILGRNMFGPVRGPWPNEDWKGWWGEEPPYHVPTFVLTHHARPTLEMQGGTTFHFVTDGPEAALERAKAAAGEKDIRLGGGADTVRQYLQLGLIDELHIAQSPVLLGSGEPLFDGLNLPALGYGVLDRTPTANAVHWRIGRA